MNLLDTPLSLESAFLSPVEQPTSAPPIPPNPEKNALLRTLSQVLVAQTTQAIETNAAAIPPLLAQRAALQTTYAALQAELAQLQGLDEVLAANEQILHEAMHEADRVMGDARQRQPPDVDEVLVAPTVVGGQLWTLCAEEAALREALFVLGRAVGKGRVGADVFVKVRLRLLCCVVHCVTNAVNPRRF